MVRKGLLPDTSSNSSLHFPEDIHSEMHCALAFTTGLRRHDCLDVSPKFTCWKLNPHGNHMKRIKPVLEAV